MYPHRIRLRGPWECEPAGQPPRRVIMPGLWADAGLARVRTTARFIRKFGYPGKADRELEHIWITCDGVTGCLKIRLNGVVLSVAKTTSFAFDVTPLLAERNQLEITIDGESDDAGLWGEVALEIRKDAYLRDVAVSQDGGILSVRGVVVGSSPQPLELYTLADGRHIDYRTIKPTLGGRRFRVQLPETPTVKSIRVELIHISEIWYVVELPISHWKAD